MGSGGRNLLDLNGQTFGRLTVLGRAPKSHESRQAFWRVRCACGRETTTTSQNLRLGIARSCGCARTTPNHPPCGDRTRRHGYSRTPTYRSWVSMWTRCTNPKVPYYHRYGGRGIRVCDRWRDFESFLADMGERPSLRFSLDRWPNPDGNYEPTNCRWATQLQQVANRGTK